MKTYKKIIKKVISNQTKHAEAEKKLTDLKKSCTNIRKRI